MLSRAHRLRRRGDFAAAIRSGRGIGRGGLVVHLTTAPPGGGTDGPRVGFVVPRAVGGAVVRNRLRRRLRHLAREHLADLSPGTLLVVRALPPAAGSSYRRLGENLAAALHAAARRAALSAAPARDAATGSRSRADRGAVGGHDRTPAVARASSPEPAA